MLRNRRTDAADRSSDCSVIGQGRPERLRAASGSKAWFDRRYDGTKSDAVGVWHFRLYGIPPPENRSEKDVVCFITSQLRLHSTNVRKARLAQLV